MLHHKLLDIGERDIRGCRGVVEPAVGVFLDGAHTFVGGGLGHGDCSSGANWAILATRPSPRGIDNAAMTNSVHIPFIDGLRAIAVVWVLAFHYFGTLFPGGFVGVDIFFVISGYLISGIIWRELDEKRFSFGHFYSRRIRRIFPALLTVLLFTLGVGLVLLHEQELRQLAKHAFAAALFLNNWALSVEKGYFDVDSEDKPLLHLWSLSIEEQFYLLWPLLLWWLARLERPPKMQRIVLGLTLASFAACALQTFTHPVGAY
ncbi:MAG: acyltransferase [Limnohabitans sp.]|nr:acyltransferase [Limnohabitans sp.]